jgi:hypothetical protein
VLAYFVACGVSRLARYNVTAEELSGDEGKVKYFEGTPIPTSLVLVLVLFVAATQGALRGELWFGKLSIAGFVPAPAGADVCGVRLADGEPDPLPEALNAAVAAQAPCASGRFQRLQQLRFVLLQGTRRAAGRAPAQRCFSAAKIGRARPSASVASSSRLLKMSLISPAASAWSR